MTGFEDTPFEDTLTEILTDEAQRHPAPTFDAYAIADGAGRVQKRTRTRFALAAGLVAAVAVSAGAVYGLSGGSGPATEAEKGDRATVTFGMNTTSQVGYAWSTMVDLMRQRAAAEGLKDVIVKADEADRQITVTGNAADRVSLEALATPGILQLSPVLDPATYGFVAPQAADCAKPPPPDVVKKLEGSQMSLVCTVDHRATLLVGPSATGVGVVTDAVARQGTTSTGVKIGLWEVDITLNAKGAAGFADLTKTAYEKGTQIAMIVDHTAYSEATVNEGPITDGSLRITGQFDEQTAKALAAVVKNGTLLSELQLLGTTDSKTP